MEARFNEVVRKLGAFLKQAGFKVAIHTCLHNVSVYVRMYT